MGLKADLIKKLKKYPLLFKIAKKIYNTLLRPVNVIIIKLRRIFWFLQKEDWPQNIRKEKYQPLISVIVPNYNHEPFLRERLESIYNQDYDNYEVILMDDCSSDNSRELLLEYANKYPDKTKVLFNEENSGGVFKQWKKGISIAKGELIWIAESDDYCSTNFLSSLKDYFQDESILIAYCRTVFVKDNKEITNIELNLSDIDSFKWRNDFVESAHNIVNSAMALKNIIPNVSSALFRRPGKMYMVDSQKWESLRFCGDWVFYLHMMRGGAIAYTTKATNYYRQHDKNTSTRLAGEDLYYKEIEYVATIVAELYDVPDQIFYRQQKMLIEYWKLHRESFDEASFQNCYDVQKIVEFKKRRKPNIAMFGFAFAAGGGETFSIILANVLYEKGYSITYVNFDCDNRVPAIRAMLNPTIPVINLSRTSTLPIYMSLAGIEILHSDHGCVDLVINDLRKYMPKCKHIITLHGFYETMNEHDLKTIIPKICKKVDFLVYTADKNLGAFKQYGLIDKNKTLKIGNALARTEINQISRKDLGINEEAFVFCVVSRAIPEKGWEEAIRCVDAARRLSGRDIQLLIIGDGAERERLQPQAGQYVHFLGFKSNIRDYFAISDMGLLPSRFRGESFPLVIIDCLFAGKPVLASDIGEVRYMMTTQNNKMAGVLFNLNNWSIPEEELTQLIIKCATDKEFYEEMLSEVEIASRKFDMENIVLEYSSVYEKLLS